MSALKGVVESNGSCLVLLVWGRWRCWLKESVTEAALLSLFVFVFGLHCLIGKEGGKAERQPGKPCRSLDVE
jgi:hypothetical protein